MLPVLVIDEANVLAEYDTEETRTLMRRLVFDTKQENQLSVLLVSWDHAFPFLLRDDLGVSLKDVKRQLFAGELAPDSMRSLLVDKWGLDPELAHYCIGLYGGHVYYTYSALEEVSLRKGDISAFGAAGPLDDVMNIICCRKAEAGKAASLRDIKRVIPEATTEDLAGLTDMLRELAATGLVPLEDATDVRARVISQYNLGAVVDAESFVLGLEKSRLRETKFKSAIVPSSQFMRMIIARELDNSGLLENEGGAPFWKKLPILRRLRR